MIDGRVLYEITSSVGKFRFSFLAIGVGITEKGYLTFNDTNRERCFDGKLVKETPDGFVWKRQAFDEVLTFRALTVKEFDKRIRSKVVGGARLPQFQSDAELHEYYRRNFL
ncbi:MAG: hypothetical protein HPY71_13575 [Firmicutes bacterium]|nr:hypothetical protein [Bacillota bacterium]